MTKKIKLRKFLAIKTRKDMDDVGMSGITFEATSIMKGDIYEQHFKLVDNNDGHGGLKKEPLNYVIDDIGCWWEINTKVFEKYFKEI